MSRITFWNILSNNLPNNFNVSKGVLIPMIQRDYAQGRREKNIEELRNQFLQKILNSILKNKEDERIILELDFIYGYKENDAFIPLDGQQRLTTLFLIHWYLAFRDKRLNELKPQLLNFSYETRASSSEFLFNIVQSLDENDYSKVFEDQVSISDLLKDKNWYFNSWEHDLTVQSMLVMLDAIHDTFKDSNIEFKDVSGGENSPIVFNFLNIKNLGLSDDLYIKMNARGKPLNAFENLKAELCRYLENSDFNSNYDFELTYDDITKKVDVKTYFITRIDTVWSNFFWDIRNPENNLFDDKLLNLLVTIGLNELALIDIEKFNAVISEITPHNYNTSYHLIKRHGLLSESCVIRYIKFLDYLVQEENALDTFFELNPRVNNKSILDNVFSKPSEVNYKDRLNIFTIIHCVNKEISTSEWTNTGRLIGNLIENTIYNTSKDYYNSLRSIEKIFNNYSNNIYHSFIETEINGFDSQQLIEERLKIELILINEEWRCSILEAEKHGYLRGRIIPIFSMSGVYDYFLENNSINKEVVEIDLFIQYYEKFCKIFDKNGLVKSIDNLFSRAFLVFCDYLLYKFNWSFPHNGFDRDISWHRLLKDIGKREDIDKRKIYIHFKNLFDKIDIHNIEKSLEDIIQKNTVNGWRRILIENEFLLSKAKKKRVRIPNKHNFYLLNGVKSSPEKDPDYRTLLIEKELIKDRVKTKLGFIHDTKTYGIKSIDDISIKLYYDSNEKKMRLNFIEESELYSDSQFEQLIHKLKLIVNENITN